METPKEKKKKYRSKAELKVQFLSEHERRLGRHPKTGISLLAFRIFLVRSRCS
jgi:hypothetical protein